MVHKLFQEQNNRTFTDIIRYQYNFCRQLDTALHGILTISLITLYVTFREVLLNVIKITNNLLHIWYLSIIIIFLSSIRSIETCYGRYKTESFHLFKGLPKFLFPFSWYFRIIFGILSELILSTCSFQFFYPDTWILLFVRFVILLNVFISSVVPTGVSCSPPQETHFCWYKSSLISSSYCPCFASIRQHQLIFINKIKLKIVCGRFVAEVAGSNPARDMDVCLLCL
jgi:hypothetical protein